MASYKAKSVKADSLIIETKFRFGEFCDGTVIVIVRQSYSSEYEFFTCNTRFR